MVVQVKPFEVVPVTTPDKALSPLEPTDDTWKLYAVLAASPVAVYEVGVTGEAVILLPLRYTL